MPHSKKSGKNQLNTTVERELDARFRKFASENRIEITDVIEMALNLLLWAPPSLVDELLKGNESLVRTWFSRADWSVRAVEKALGEGLSPRDEEALREEVLRQQKLTLRGPARHPKKKATGL